MPGDTEQLAVVDGVGPGTAAAGSGAVEASKAHASSQPTTQSSAQVTKRLQSELMALMTSAQNDGVSAFPDGDNIFIWIGTIVGGAGTVYENLSYKLSLKFPVDYPFQPPTVKFETPCFHPNVDQYGNICLDILREKWSASYTVRTILLSIQSLLGEPNNESPLNGYAAHLWSNEEEYLKVLTKKYQEAVGTNK